MTWKCDDSALHEKEKAEVEAHFPELRFVVENNLVYVRGSFTVMFEGQVLDRYSVKLQRYPSSPFVRLSLALRFPDAMPTDSLGED